MVFCLADPFALAMIHGFRPDVINLGAHYAPGKDRRQTYREIDAPSWPGPRRQAVCAVFYGHPGRVRRRAARSGAQGPRRRHPGAHGAGYFRRGLPYADLGMDPGLRGVQSMEATHFLVYGAGQPDTAGLVLLWQVALSGDLSCTRLHAEREGCGAGRTSCCAGYAAARPRGDASTKRRDCRDRRAHAPSASALCGLP